MATTGRRIQVDRGSNARQKAMSDRNTAYRDRHEKDIEKQEREARQRQQNRERRQAQDKENQVGNQANNRLSLSGQSTNVGNVQETAYGDIDRLVEQGSHDSPSRPLFGDSTMNDNMRDDRLGDSTVTDDMRDRTDTTGLRTQPTTMSQRNPTRDNGV